MLKRVAVAVLLVGVVVGGLAVALGVWLVYQPVKADVVVYDRYQAAATAYPALGGVLWRAYHAYDELTRANTLHYIVHEAAARFAALTGHMHAAGVQAHRAAYHVPEHGGALTSLLVEFGHGLARLRARLP